MRLGPGVRVGPYEVVAPLGAGGMAEVYRARDTRLGRTIALKVVNEVLAGSPELIRRFEQEARLAGSLNHPNVVAIYDVGLHEGAPFFVTELLQGESLRQRLSRGRLPLQTALDWAAQIAQGLSAAHARGVIHRDVKPDNVFISSDGHVKLLDFGIAKLAEEARDAGPHGLMDDTVTPAGDATRTGSVLGTPGYMSPEQVRGDSVDARTDIFSLGAVLYELLSANRAFPGATFVESGHAILHDDPAPLPQSVPKAVAQIVDRCLEKNREQRFQSARDLAFHLAQLRSSTGPISQIQWSKTYPLRWRPWVRGGIFAVALVLASAGLFVALRPKTAAMPSVEGVTFERGLVTGARFNPEGRVLFSAAWEGAPLQVYTRAPGDPEAHALGIAGATLAAVSNHGELAVLLDSRGERWFGHTLAVVPGAGGPPKRVAEDVLSADWAPNGDLAVVRQLGTGTQLEFPLGTPVAKSSGYIRSPRVSPRGDAIAFIDDNGFNLRVYESATRHTRDLCPAGSWEGIAWTPSGKDILFAVADSIWASTLSGRQRLLYRGLGPLWVQDISRTGQILVYAGVNRFEVAAMTLPQKIERRLSWLDETHLTAISADGRQVLITSWPTPDAPTAYIRDVEGGPPVRVGLGLPLDLSPDGRWVLARPGNPPGPELIVLPVGAGIPRKLTFTGFKVATAKWLHDGKHVVVVGLRDDGSYRFFRVALEEGIASPVGDFETGPFGPSISNDDGFIAARDTEGFTSIFPLDGGAPFRLSGVQRWVYPVQWTPDGQLWLRDASPPGPMRLLRYDLSKRAVVAEQTLIPADSDGLREVVNVKMTPDARVVGFQYLRTPGNLYLLDGLLEQ